MNIREMTASDWNAVAQIYQDGIHTGLATLQSEIPTYADCDDSHLKECRLIAMEDDTVYRWVALSPVSSRCVY